MLVSGIAQSGQMLALNRQAIMRTLDNEQTWKPNVKNCIPEGPL